MAQRDNNEAAVIGSILIDPSCLKDVDSAGLSAEDFESDVWRMAFKIIEEMRADGVPIDPLVLSDRMAKWRPGDYTELLYEAIAVTTTAANIEAYVEIVKDNAKRRRFVEALVDASSLANYGDWRAQADVIFNVLNELKGTEADVFTGEALADGFLDYYDRTKENPDNAYCKTGFADLDRQLGGGMFKSEVYIIGARPGMGKTTLGINIAQNVVNRGGSVLFVSLEMSKDQIQAKRISLETSIRYTDLMTGRLNAAEEDTMRKWVLGHKNQPFFLTTRSLTVGEIARKARQIKNVDCVIVDYIGLISCSEESRQKPRYEQMTEISAALKATAKALNVPVLALCQLNRENTTRSDKRPTMADLRDSGAIEQDAGAIVLLHRPDYYVAKESGETPEIEEIELNVAKNRHAEPGLVRMWWHGNIGKISMKAMVGAPLAVEKEEELPF